MQGQLETTNDATINNRRDVLSVFTSTTINWSINWLKMSARWLNNKNKCNNQLACNILLGFYTNRYRLLHQSMEWFTRKLYFDCNNLQSIRIKRDEPTIREVAKPALVRPQQWLMQSAYQAIAISTGARVWTMDRCRRWPTDTTINSSSSRRRCALYFTRIALED